MLFPEIKPAIRSEYEELTHHGSPIGSKMLDFWKWSMSNILGNTDRGALAEFIVATAVGFEQSMRNDWGGYDLTADNGRIKIEVKSAAYIQTWEQSKLSNIIFNTKAPVSTNTRPSDIYVFCLLKHKEQETIDPLKLEQWEFYVLQTETLNRYERSKVCITLNSLRKLTDAISYSQLRDIILDYK